MNLFNYHSKPTELLQYNDRFYLIPELALATALHRTDQSAEDINRLEKAIAKDLEVTMKYVQKTKKPFPLGEPVISKDPHSSFWYAVITGKPFKLGEPAIATTGDDSFSYADDVLHGPFPLGEPAIAKHHYFAIKYALEILKGPFPLGEETIAHDADDSVKYAKLINKQFTLGENEIKKSPFALREYNALLKSLNLDTI